jgi:hypothetical protein
LAADERGRACADLPSFPIQKQPDLPISYNGVSALFLKNHTLRNLLKEASAQCCENDQLRNNTGATFSSWEEDVAKLCCLFLLNGNRISQQRFMPEDLVQVVET